MRNITHEQIFISVIESGSFKSAGDNLAIDPSLISRKVANLEERLGVKLLNRSTKRSTLTEAGKLYFDGIRRLTEERLALEQKISQATEQPTGTLRVSAPHDFGAFFVAPVLSSMTRKYPELIIELMLSSQYEDLVSKGIDVAIRIGDLPDSQLICQKLGNINRVMVASAGYIEKYGKPRNPAELSKHQFIFYTKEQANKALQFNDGQQTTEIKVQGRMTVNSVSVIRQLVLEGAGIHQGPVWAFQDDLQRGSLVSLFDDYPKVSYPLYAIYVSKAYTPAKSRLFIERMRARLQGKF